MAELPRAALTISLALFAAFMMYMTGGGIQIFSVMSVVFLLKGAIQGMFSVEQGKPPPHPTLALTLSRPLTPLTDPHFATPPQPSPPSAPPQNPARPRLRFCSRRRSTSCVRLDCCASGCGSVTTWDFCRRTSRTGSRSGTRPCLSRRRRWRIRGAVGGCRFLEGCEVGL